MVREVYRDMILILLITLLITPVAFAQEPGPGLTGGLLGEEMVQVEALEAPDTFNYPPQVDWRPILMPARNQGLCKSCTAFAILGAVEGRYTVQRELCPDLAEAHLFFCGGGQCDRGMYLADGLKFILNIGVTDEGCFPYMDHELSCNPCREWENYIIRIEKWWGTNNTDVMKQAIADDGPVIFTVAIDSGVHAITAVGYDDLEGYWIVRDSYGPRWGDNGYFKVVYGQDEVDNYAYIPELSDTVLGIQDTCIYEIYLPIIAY